MRTLKRRADRNKISSFVPTSTLVCAVEPLEGRQMLSVTPAAIIVDTPGNAATTLAVIVGSGGAKTITFVDAAGRTDVVSYKGAGSATVNFTGTNLATTAPGRRTQVITGSGIGVTSFVATGTTTHTSISLKSKGAGAVAIGDFSADGGLGSLSGPFDLSGAFSVGGALGKLSVATASGTGTLTATSLSSLKVGGDLAESINISGPVGTIAVGGNVTSAAISAGTFKTISVKGNMTGTTITASAPLAGRSKDISSLSVGGVIQNSNIVSAGTVSSIKAGGLAGDNIQLGLSLANGDVGLPTVASELTAQATLSSLSTRSAAGTNIVAYTIGKVSLGTLQTANGTVPFGFAGHTISQITGTASVNGRKFKLRKLSDPTLTNTQLANAGLNAPGVDFVVRIL